MSFNQNAASGNEHPENISNFLQILLCNKQLTFIQYSVLIDYLMTKRNEQYKFDHVHPESIVSIMTDNIEDPTDTTANIENFRVRKIYMCVKNEEENEILLVSNCDRPEEWTVPVGKVAGGPHSTIDTSVFAASVIGKVGRCLGIIKNVDRKHQTEVFIVNVAQELPIHSGLNLRWFTIKDAIKQFEEYPVQLSYINALVTSRKAACSSRSL